MATYAVNGDALTGIANAIRSKTGSDEQMPIAAMAAAIDGIPTGGGAAVDVIHVAPTVALGYTSDYYVAHSLGVEPDVILVLCDDPTNLTQNPSVISVAYCRYMVTENNANGFVGATYASGNGSISSVSGFPQAGSSTQSIHDVDASGFLFRRAQVNAYMNINRTYTIYVIKF